MGLFDYFKNKQTKDSILAETKINEISLSNFKFYYLYGLTDNPNKLSNDATAFNKLYKKVIGTTNPRTKLGIVDAAVALRLVPNCSAAIVTKTAQ